MAEITEQLIFPVFWSTQYYRIVLFSLFWSYNCLHIFAKQINCIRPTTDEIFPIFTIPLLIRGAIFLPYFRDKALLNRTITKWHILIFC